MSTVNSRRGMAYFVVMAFAVIMAMFLMLLGRMNSGAIQLLSKNARDHLAAMVAEAGLNCIIAELHVNNDYTTHGMYKWGGDAPWAKPIKDRPSALKAVRDLETFGVKEGVYRGKLQDAGEFKVKLAGTFGKDNPLTKTLKENQMYLVAEVVAAVRAGGKSEEQSYRRVKALIEKRSVASEHLLFDGEMLDMGLGPYVGAPNQLRRGRLYGYQWVTFNSAGGPDKGSEMFEMEKIETAGMIKAGVKAPVEFADKTSTSITAGNDSTSGKFKTYDGYLLDGNTGGRPIKMAELPKDSYLAKAKRRKNTGGLVIEAGKVPSTIPLSTWKNPYDEKTDYYDLNFGGYVVGQDEPDADGDSQDEADDTNANDPPYGSDDPAPPGTLRGRALLIYSEVPLRIWGCPDRSVTIFCEKDVVIAGDFNQNPDTMQDYPDTTYQTYKTPIQNGKRFHKVGAMILSMGRVMIDHSRPSLFLYNEMRAYLSWLIAMALHPVDKETEEEARKALCPADPKKRGGIIGLGAIDPATNRPKPIYNEIYFLKEQTSVATGPLYMSHMADLIELFTPGNDARPRFGIKNEVNRLRVIQEIDQACRGDGVITRDDFDRIVNLAWEFAVEEEAKEPSADQGAMGLARFLFDEAGKKPDDGLWPPEITVNAALVTSTRRHAKWTTGNAGPKVFDEIGNINVKSKKLVEYLKPPKFLIQRVFGSEIRLGSRAETWYLSGDYTGQGVLRRRIWDKSLTGGKYQPTALPFAFNIFSYSEEAISKKEYEAF
ncbi:MAG TPA: hypothetical protein PKO06_07690 [Candidatus Ozemobacteraceae bacterium]|nr:hypothetical protein [Candidatus Ozemobacteraceae bacterium]